MKLPVPNIRVICMSDWGWIKLHRKVTLNWIWENPEYLKAWIDLMMMANHEPRKKLINNNLVEIGTGQRDLSVRFLSDRWKWSPNKVSRFLRNLKNDGMVNTATDTGQTIITICNYETYQANIKLTDTATNTLTNTPTRHQRTHQRIQREELKELEELKETTVDESEASLFQIKFFKYWVGEHNLMGTAPTPMERKDIMEHAYKFNPEIDFWVEYLEKRMQRIKDGLFAYPSIKGFCGGGFRDLDHETPKKKNISSVESKFDKFKSGLYKAWCSKCGKRSMPSDKFQLIRGSECCSVDYLAHDPKIEHSETHTSTRASESQDLGSLLSQFKEGGAKPGV